MPWRDYQDDNCNDFSHNGLERDLRDANKNLAAYEAGFCAVVNELSRLIPDNKEFEKTLLNLKKENNLDIQKLWEKHLAQDISRVKKKIATLKFSKDEIRILNMIKGEI